METAEQSASTVLVCGATRGIGAAVARALREAGHRVHGTWRREGEASERLRERLGERVHRCDLMHADQVQRTVDAVLERDGRLDALVHAAGDYEHGALADLTPERLRALYDSNVTTAMHSVAAGRAALRASAGAWLFFGCAGLGNLRARRTSAGYGAVKSALVVLVRSLALEEAPHGVRANLVSPGLVPHDDAHPDTRRDPVARTPLPGGIEASDVAGAALWLLSPAAARVTGQELEVAGGFAL